MGIWKGIVWAVARNTEPGRKALGKETLLEQGVRERKLGRIARVAYQNSLAQQGRDLQYEDEDCEVRVKMGYNRDHGCYVTDIIVKPKGDGWHGSHQHVIIDEQGNEIMNEWRDKR